ncbi:MAG: TonB-dependent receptor, partial [Cytophagaceae bacterium]|nr:TonB-dependent receptor [Cytophagaceae bacterium]
MNLYLHRRKTFKIFFFLIFFVFFLSKAFAQTPVSGKVLDQNGKPVPGVAVITKDSSAGATTAEDGSFYFESEATPPITIIIGSVPGFDGQEIVYTGPETNLNITLKSNAATVPPDTTAAVTDEVNVTARRRKENPQEIPIAVSVVSGNAVTESGAFNVNRVKELVPTVQLYSSNPRNTTLNIRGMGSTFGLTNDGIDPGVGFYIDGVYYARPAATALDFIDVEQIEVLRGPQGTLFGKNTTAGAFNITTRKPSFKFGSNLEVSYGNYGFIQAKSSITGPLIKDKLAVRVSFSGTQRDGNIYNVATLQYVNDINNIGGRAQLLFTPTSKINILLIGDVTRQRPNGYAQVFAGVVPTQRAAYRQFEAIIDTLGYELPSRNPFDRKIDHNTTWKSNNDLGGVSLNIDAKIGSGTLTSTSAWRYWLWDPSNDRDFTGLEVLRRSEGTSKHQNWSQEIRYAGKISERFSGVIGVFAIGQDLQSNPVQIEESGSAQWAFSRNSLSANWKTPGLLDGYGIKTTNRIQSLSAAAFANVDWEIIKKLHIQPGIRYNYDVKEVSYDRQTYGGLQTNNPALIAIKNSVYSNQSYATKKDNTNLSGQLTVAYKASKRFNTYATYSTNYKPIGVNIAGLPTNAGAPMLELATVKPEYVQHFEVGVKTKPSSRSTVNVTFFNTDIKDYQTQVQSAELGVNRGYLANAERARVYGFELDANIRLSNYFAFYGAGAYIDGRYVKFTNAPLPLEETGASVSFKDISGGKLPGISDWSGSVGGEATTGEKKFLAQQGKFFIAFDTYYRSKFSSSPSPSKYLNVGGYALLNSRIGFRATDGVSIT